MTEPKPEKAAGAHMRAEVDSIPEVVAGQLAAHGEAYAALGARWRAAPPAFFATCARGTSDQAALYFKYLTEIGSGIPVASLGPSLGSVYDGPLHVAGATVLTISQSGASPDLVALMRKAAAADARTAALVNTAQSPLAEVCDDVLPIGAGTERAVAATKSFVSSLVALAAIHAAAAGDKTLAEGLKALPEKLAAAVSGRDDLIAPLAGARDAFCLGRGISFAIAGEMALKLKETCLIGAEGMSSAEFRHGPMALGRPGTAALVLLDDARTRAGSEEVVRLLRDNGAKVITLGTGAVDIPVPASGHHALDAITMITAFYTRVVELAVSLGHDPDQPPNLKKATLTV